MKAVKWKQDVLLSLTSHKWTESVNCGHGGRFCTLFCFPPFLFGLGQDALSAAPRAWGSSCSRKDTRKAVSLLAPRCHINLKRKVAKWLWLQMGTGRLGGRQRRSELSQAEVLVAVLRGDTAWAPPGFVSHRDVAERAFAQRGCFSFSSWQKRVSLSMFDTTVSRNQEIAASNLRCWFRISCWA